MCSNMGVGEAEVGLVAGGFVANVAFGGVVAEEAEEVGGEGEVGVDGVVLARHTELCCCGDFIPVEYAFAFKNFKVG